MRALRHKFVKFRLRWFMGGEEKRCPAAYEILLSLVMFGDAKKWQAGSR
jgi:hypothetical protein